LLVVYTDDHSTYEKSAYWMRCSADWACSASQARDVPTNSDSFRAGMRHLAAGVCVITTAAVGNKRSGLTATAVCSVSADPPTLLVSINSASGTCAAIRATGHFAVNLLSVQDREVARRFASPIPPEDRFAGGAWDILVTGSPALASAVAVFDCNVGRVVEVATHTILIGAIEAVRISQSDERPLLHAHAAFASLSPIDAIKGTTQSHDLQFLEDCLHWGLM
jgi:flavin reductase (DIM6/NTAB) family NADH-FMN oxidoreductase RutF